MSSRVSDLRRRYRYNMICRVFFLWVEPLLWTGFKRNLEQSDLEVNPEELDSRTLFNTFNGYWDQELERKKCGKSARLRLVIFKCIWWRLIVQGALTFFEIGVQVLQSVLTGYLSQYFAEQIPTSRDTRNAYISAGCLVAMALLVSVIHGHALLMGQKIGMIVRISTSAAIHNKIMKINQETVGQLSAGHVVNLASNDVQRFDQAFMFLHQLWIGPLLLATFTYLLYTNLGFASLIPMEIILVALPVQVLLSQLFSSVRFTSASHTDKRIKIMNEIISGMRVIKMYGWEEAFKRIVRQLRRKESLCVLKAGLLHGSNLAIEHMSIPLMMFGIFSVHMATGGILTAKTVFTVLSLLSLIQRNIMRLYIRAVFLVIEANVAVTRIKAFLELGEGSSPDDVQVKHKVGETRSNIDKNGDDMKSLSKQQHIEAKHLYASWAKNEKENMTLQNITFSVNKDAPFLAIVGPIGAGKSTLLQCLLGELKPVHGNVDVRGKLSYATQDPWLFTGTLRENILFGSPLHIDWYDAVLDACALHQDIEQLPNRDLTIIGERGVTLSGGQKARVSLARAVYTDCDVYLLDDPLSAVDTVVAKHIFERCIRGLLKDRLVVLVTHQVHFAEQADNILVINDGKMTAYGNMKQLRTNYTDPTKILGMKTKDKSSSGNNTDESTCASSNTRKTPANSSEERNHGTIKLQTYIQYLKMGASPMILVLVFGVLAVGEASRVVSDWWIADWADCYSLVNDTFPKINDQRSCLLTRTERLDIYAGITIANVILNMGRVAFMYVILIKASNALHNGMLASVLGLPIRFFDINPIGRILNRFSKDVSSLDDYLPIQITELLLLSLRSVAAMLTSTIANVWILIPTCLFVGAFFALRWYYLKTSRDIKRLEAIARSPIYSHLSESLLGLSTIRTFGREQTAQEYFHQYLDQYSKGCYLYFITTRWFGMRIDGLMAILLAAVAFSSIPLASTLDPGLVGLALTYTVSLSGMFQFCVRLSADVENTMVSAERLLQYSHLETETSLSSHSDKKPDSGWPNAGMIVFDKASFCYSADTPLVLKSLSFTIQPGEKVGIIGRTGAGKSSLIQMLFRMAEHTGNIYIDGIDTKQIALNELRKCMSIIPQDPVLFSGSLRYNLDPFEEYKDPALWSALEQVQLKSAVEKWDGQLEFKVSEGGRNFSIGQRQLVCLARAILRKNKILVLDEATANVDYVTDATIQKILHETFAQCTVLTVAHRLNTIIDSDRIMVLDGGEVIEFDDPYILLKDQNSLLNKMVDKMGPSGSEQLYQMAEVAYLNRTSRHQYKICMF